MHRINKLNYFVGVFLSTIISSSKGVPTLIDQTKESKRVEFVTDLGDFNVYIKYTTKPRRANVNLNGKKKRKLSWDINFSYNEYDILKNSFIQKDKENLICLVCTTDELNSTYMAVLDYDDALKCLKNSTKSGSRRITVSRIGSEHDFICYGVSPNEEDYIRCPVDCTKFLGIEDKANS